MYTPPELEIAISWRDDDILEIFVRAGNGRFAGVSEFYDGHDAFSRAAAALDAFPKNASDLREIVFGSMDEKSRGGVRLVFRCINAAGRAVVDVTMHYRPQDLNGPLESASFQLNVEASSVDSFIRSLRSLNSRARGKANLAVGATES